MESRAKALGHPMHPMLIVFPLGLLSTGVIFDLVHLITDDPTFAQVAFWTITAGLVGSVPAALTGLVDYLAIPGGTRAKRIALLHGLGNAAVVTLFLVVWLVRLGDDDNAAGVLGFVTELVAAGIAMVTGWLGGELVDRLGVGVTPGAHLDAPSSLSREPVGDHVTGG